MSLMSKLCIIGVYILKSYVQLHYIWEAYYIFQICFTIYNVLRTYAWTYFILYFTLVKCHPYKVEEIYQIQYINPVNLWLSSVTFNRPFFIHWSATIEYFKVFNFLYICYRAWYNVIVLHFRNDKICLILLSMFKLFNGQQR